MTRTRATARHITCLLALLAALAPAQLSSQTSQKDFDERWRAAPQTGAKPQAKPRAKPQSKLPVSLPQALYLIRSTLLTLNDANRSGNYTVLRDLAGPSFRDKNSAADLAIAFTDLRRRKFDLSAAALIAPQLTAVPTLDTKNMLRLTGYFPTRPLRINFDLSFQEIEGQWKLFGLSIATPRAPPPATQAAAPPPRR